MIWPLFLFFSFLILKRESRRFSNRDFIPWLTLIEPLLSVLGNVYQVTSPRLRHWIWPWNCSRAVSHQDANCLLKHKNKHIGTSYFYLKPYTFPSSYSPSILNWIPFRCPHIRLKFLALRTLLVSEPSEVSVSHSKQTTYPMSGHHF